jgi:diacylglycerol O-acyltransferase / wax synthase
MKRMPGKDALFLWVETPTTHMHIAFAGVFDPSTMPGGEDLTPAEVYERFLGLMRDRIHLIPQFRQRVVRVPFNLDNPYLVDDPHFDLDYHVRRIALPSPGGQAELEEFVSRFVSRPLDKNRPLWELYIVEGLEGGRWAYVAKAHHVLVDGVGGNEMLVNLLDLEPEPREVEAPETAWEPEKLPGELSLLRHAATGTARKPLRFLETARRTVSSTYELVRWQFDSTPESMHVLGPRSFLNGPIGPHRQVAFGQWDLDMVKAIKDEVGCTVNDVVLAVLGRGLRRFVEENGEHLDRGLVASVPISIRGEGDGTMDNQVSGMTVPLHDDVEEPREQLRRIRSATEGAKDRMGAVAATVLTDWSENAVPAVAAQAFRFYTQLGLARRHPPIANVTVSNVPGPPIPLYLAGSKMEAMYPIGPVVHNQRLNLTVVSYLDRMYVGAIADREHVPDVRGLIDHIRDEVKRLADEVGVAR